MALIQIFSLTGQELEYKKDSLTLKKENNSLSSDFKVPHSSFPFLVIENDNTKEILGPSDITSIRKNKIIPVFILENGVRYYGELQQLTVLLKFRKCNLKYGSDAIAIINKKIAKYMPVISVIPGETSPVPFTETAAEIITGTDNWATYPNALIGEIYPTAKFQFPMLFWKNKFGDNLEDTDPYSFYGNHLNNFQINDDGTFTFLQNPYAISSTEVTAENRNIVSPQVFLLSPLSYIFSDIDWKISGTFVENEFIRKLLLLSEKTNNTEVTLFPTQEDVVFDGSWTTTYLQFPDAIKRKSEAFVLPKGKYIIHYRMNLPENTISGGPSIKTSLRAKVFTPLFGVDESQVGFNANTNLDNELFEGEFEIDVRVNGFELRIYYYSYFETMPLDYEIFFRLKDLEKIYSFPHPTIDLSRYVPDWSVGNYLNYLKNKFNLEITLDDFKKEIILNFNEDFALNEEVAIISQSLEMKSYDIAANSSFVLKYENDEDAALFITRDEIIAFDGNKDDFTKILESKFKLVPYNGYTSEISEALIEKDGVGLMIYEPQNAPYTSAQTIDGMNLNIPGTKGIYETFWKRWIKFLLNGSNCEVNGYFTETEISKIKALKAVFINNQRFRIIDIQTTEASNNFQEVKMRLLSVNY